jgi:hypothetical protein
MNAPFSRFSNSRPCAGCGMLFPFVSRSAPSGSVGQGARPTFVARISRDHLWTGDARRSRGLVTRRSRFHTRVLAIRRTARRGSAVPTDELVDHLCALGTGACLRGDARTLSLVIWSEQVAGRDLRFLKTNCQIVFTIHKWRRHLNCHCSHPMVRQGTGLLQVALPALRITVKIAGVRNSKGSTKCKPQLRMEKLDTIVNRIYCAALPARSEFRAARRVWLVAYTAPNENGAVPEYRFTFASP